jgi:rod shape-determining protein MreD
MSWGLFAVVLLIVYVLQTAVLPHVAPAWLDLLLALALLCGLTAPAADARLAGWVVGLAQDVGGDGALGIHALGVGLSVLLLTRLREVVNRELWWVRWLAGLVVSWPALLLVQLHDRYLQGAALSWPQMLGHALLTAMIASLVAALVLRLPRALRRRPHSMWV